jgi:hypothetical protein
MQVAPPHPLMHCELRVQAPPSACVGWQTPMVAPLPVPSHQKSPAPPLAEVGVQLASPVASFVPQPCRHAVALAQMRLPEHGPITALLEHVPVPLHAAKVPNMALEQTLAVQAVAVEG